MKKETLCSKITHVPMLPHRRGIVLLPAARAAAPLWMNILNPFFNIIMSPYGWPRISNLPGLTLKGHAPFGFSKPSWKHSQKWPGYLGMLQKAYMDRLGLAVQ
jgi:hypothetical protein